MKLEPIIQLPNMMTGMWRRFGVHAFEGALTLDDMARIEAAGSLWHKKNPGRRWWSWSSSSRATRG